MKNFKKTREDQYNALYDAVSENEPYQLGLMSNHTWENDPKRLLFVMSRYKFVSRILEGRSQILEIGCADGFGTRIVQQTTGNMTVVDFDPVFVEEVQGRKNTNWKMNALVHDMLDGAVAKSEFDGAYALDVLEHVDQEHEHTFIKNVAASIKDDGVVVFGMPSLESQDHASAQSKIGHINCKSGPDFRSTMEKHFKCVFMFSMNDEVVHTGFFPMAHYLFAVCCYKKK